MDVERLAGTKLGNYEIESLLDRGGMGMVYKARQLNLDRPAALRILPPILSSDASFVKRFKREARTVAKLSHSNITQIFDITEEQNLHFFSMEYVESFLAMLYFAFGDIDNGFEWLEKACDGGDI